eukprot:Hpha_TRINITY_DN15407_c1_g5::TRINITY_DN15407_c1_g5_i1::g.172984::m.172984/K19191/mabO; 4-methylaminobutanoate oxidase (formaldehyde-forming)
MVLRRARFASGADRQIRGQKLLPMSVRARGMSAAPQKKHPWGNLSCNYGFDKGALPNGIRHENAAGNFVDDSLDIFNNFVLTEGVREGGAPRKSSLFETLMESGAKPCEVNNGFSSMLRTLYFPNSQSESQAEAVEREYWACRNAAAVWDMSSFVKLRIEGPDACSELERLCSLKIDRKVEDGKLVYCCLTNEDGGIAADVTVLRESRNSFYMVVGAELLRQTLEFFRSNVRPDARLKVRDVSGSVGVLHIAGPKSREVMQAAVPNFNFSNEAQPFGTARTVTLGGDPCLGGEGVRVRALRISFMGDLGWELHCAMDDLPAVYDLIKNSGADHGLVDAGYACIGALRTERMFLHWGEDWRKGVDLTADEIPTEVGMPVKKSPEFQGQEAIKERRKHLTKRLVTIVVTGSNTIRLTGMEILKRDGKKCGFVATGNFSYSLGSPVGIGWVTRDDGEAADWSWILDESARYTVVTECGAEVECQIKKEAAFDPAGERARA